MDHFIDKIRNFSIIAHIDHGKSTLADRIIEITKGIEARLMKPQFLDKMDIERERGITIKAQPISLRYRSKDGNDYNLNLIDTPGHVDFSYEVSRSLAAGEGAILLVDATQGLEAQTFSHMFLAFEEELDIIPVINKIDLENARVPETLAEIRSAFGYDESEVIKISAKEGHNIDVLLESIIQRIKPPKREYDRSRALIFDAHYDVFRGVILHVRVFDGIFKRGDVLIFNSSKQSYEIIETGVFKEKLTPSEKISEGQVGYIIAGIKKLQDVNIGDTLFLKNNDDLPPLKGFKKIKPMVYAGVYPTDNDDYEKLRNSIEKISLNDSSLEYSPEVSNSLGFGFRVGFLGLLHMEIISERLKREYEIDIVVTSPSVVYRIHMIDGNIIDLYDCDKFPEPVKIDIIEEPYVRSTIITFISYMDPIIRLIEEKRGVLTEKIEYIGDNRIIIYFDIPLSEIISNFFDRMKSVSRGLASLDYGNSHYKTGNIVKVDILLNGKPVSAFSFLSDRGKAEKRSREIIEKLKVEIPRHLFLIKLQAAIGGKIIASVQISALRKDVTAKCYGGDITRKRKLLEKQKQGKKKMRSIGNINVPKEAFLRVLKID